jgi:hypothetical protein
MDIRRSNNLELFCNDIEFMVLAWLLEGAADSSCLAERLALAGVTLICLIGR